MLRYITQHDAPPNAPTEPLTPALAARFTLLALPADPATYVAVMNHLTTKPEDAFIMRCAAKHPLAFTATLIGAAKAVVEPAPTPPDAPYYAATCGAAAAAHAKLAASRGIIEAAEALVNLAESGEPARACIAITFAALSARGLGVGRNTRFPAETASVLRAARGIAIGVVDKLAAPDTHVLAGLLVALWLAHVLWLAGMPDTPHMEPVHVEGAPHARTPRVLSEYDCFPDIVCLSAVARETITQAFHEVYAGMGVVDALYHTHAASPNFLDGDVDENFDVHDLAAYNIPLPKRLTADAPVYDERTRRLCPWRAAVESDYNDAALDVILRIDNRSARWCVVSVPDENGAAEFSALAKQFGRTMPPWFRVHDDIYVLDASGAPATPPDGAPVDAQYVFHGDHVYATIRSVFSYK